MIDNDVFHFIDSTNKFTVTSASQYVWQPLPDITPYELALCIPAIVAHWRAAHDYIVQLPAEAQRHFQRIA